MALTHLVDTTVLTRIAHPKVQFAIEPLLLSGSVARTGVSDLEIGSSAQTSAEWDRLADAIDVFPLVETTKIHFRRALQVQRLMVGLGLTGAKIPELVVAAAAEALGLVVLHYDANFDLISRATGQPSAWVVAAREVD
jgi:predicted nucleic acid-binding protein